MICVMVLDLTGLVWQILLYLKGDVVDYLSPYLDVLDASKLPQGWSRCAQFSLKVVNQLQPSESHFVFHFSMAHLWMLRYCTCVQCL
ncbi:putative ubiquitinyl hydrolase 1 [Rosa chinensis]|uniref:Putative ubiquitinyl hydrolase 1 n=1 Tax=Rosa chinensis TaxID=74649 RepID=A0A2P6QCT1_ROSCH|nr:putative ubiquitinyl hydrolase 1 [Rosa chinensis]